MTKVPSIEKAVVLKCSQKTRKLVIDYSNQSGFSMRQIVDDMVDDWMRTVGKARLEHLKSMPISQNENLA